MFIFIEDNLEQRIPESRILEKLQLKFSLTEKQAIDCLNQAKQTHAPAILPEANI